MTTKTATTQQAQAYLKELGYQNPDSTEIQGAISELNSNPDLLSKYSGTTGTSAANGDGNGKDGSGLSPQDMWGYASKTGITQAQYNTLNPQQQAIIASIGEASGTLYGTNSGVTLSDAIRLASSDPSIVAKYSDAAALDSQAFTDSLASIQASAETTAETQKQQFEQDRKQLAEAHAAAGTAYSGFRQQAQNNLETQESGIVRSSLSQTKQQLNQLSQNFASKYGSAVTPNASVTTVNPLAGGGTTIAGTLNMPGTQDNITTTSPNTPSGIIGSAPINKNADILSGAQEFYQTGQTPNL